MMKRYDMGETFKRAARTIGISAVMTVAALISQGSAVSAIDDEFSDPAMIKKIRAEGLENSAVMDYASYLTDVIGPRLSASPAMRRAGRWSVAEFEKLGLMASLQGFDFGYGWEADYARASFEMVEKGSLERRKGGLEAFPVSWNPGTRGPVTGQAKVVSFDSVAGVEGYLLAYGADVLRGKMLMISPQSKPTEPSNDVFNRYSKSELRLLENSRDPQLARSKISKSDAVIVGEITRKAKRVARTVAMTKALKKAGVLALVGRSSKSGGIHDASGYNHRPGSQSHLPRINLSSEHYNRLMRLIASGETVSLTVDVKARFFKKDQQEYNTIAQIEGSDKAAEIVMAGAHMDSWHLGDGAVDNAAGVAVVMEAARILSVLDIKPRRTIRFALWGGEEQGLLGSLAYVQNNFAAYPKLEGVKSDRSMALYSPAHHLVNPTKPLIKKPAFDDFSVYFNLDNGSGKIRGLYTHGNSKASDIFAEWLKPFNDLGASTLSRLETRGSDHMAFQSIGLPGYQFIQDPLDYSSRLHHSQLDVADNLYPDDLRQAATIMAAFIYNAAMRDEKMPR